MKKRELLNKKQGEFYNTKKKNLATRVWSYFRNGALNRIKKEIEVEKDIYALHVSWFGDLTEKKVLDLGCYAGNSLSMYLATHSRQYLGIDLSEKGIAGLSSRLKDIPNANAIVMDFLSDEFKEKDFDLIYAYGVLHHFKEVEELIEKLKEKTTSNGLIISHDPLQTSLSINILRRLYRPFQSDKEWEWPFRRATYYQFEKAFEIKERRGVLGKAKWSGFLNLLPISQNSKLGKAKEWHLQDWKISAESDEHMFSCMHLSMLMKKK
ncbi:class I SAM-dependent methyltransferase [Salinimicrobium terrae]|uniref:class I SAM-dependent methyltransferase n=1 Tax=Salinimicrobium terrae TaxID=470866 RepID=UPI000562773A|nr:class I SAM-dependent methyltransferase [Salinimicrobium terrae]